MFILTNKLVTNILLCAIKIYQLCISPLFAPSCRFNPTCSCYMRDAINIHGSLFGTILGIKRLIKCHPLSNNEYYDPVPSKKRS